MNDRTRYLEEEKISQLLWKFSVPAIIGTLATSVYTIIDRMFVGNIVGADAIAGLSVTMPIAFVIMAFGMLIGMGSGTLVSIRLGQQKKDEAEVILGNAFSLVIIVAVIISGFFLLFQNRILTHFGASPATLPYARQFISIILYGSIFQYILFGLAMIIRAEGNPRIAMTIQLANAVLNIVLDYIFIYLLGWGIRGTAIATVISQGISALLVLAHFRGSKSLLRLDFSKMRLHLGIMQEILTIGFPPFSMQLIASVVNILYNQDLAHNGGDAAIGAFGIINSIVMFILMPVIGINQGAQPIMGFNYGARKYQRVRETLKKAILAATAMVCLGFLMMQLFPRQILRLFTADPNLLAIGTQGMHLLTLLLPVVGFQIVGTSFFQAIGKARQALILSVSRQLLFLIPMLIILPRYFHLQGVWLSAPMADGASAILTLFMLLAELRHLKGEGDEVGVSV